MKLGHARPNFHLVDTELFSIWRHHSDRAQEMATLPALRTPQKGREQSDHDVASRACRPRRGDALRPQLLQRTMKKKREGITLL
jgi:hypothetical protein